MDRRKFVQHSLAGMAALAAASSPVLGVAAESKGRVSKKRRVPLNLSFQEGITPGESLNAKLDFLEKLGVTGFEPSGNGLAGRVGEFQSALRGRNIKISAICAGFQGFILSEDPAVKAQFDTTMRQIVAAAGQLGSTGVIMVPAFKWQKKCRPHTLETRNFLCEQLHELGEYALKCGTTVILEPLNRKEAFYMRLVADAAAIARDSQSEGVKCMGDFWHMQEETSDYAAFMAAGPYLRHVHIASRANRHLPGEDGEADNYMEGFRALKEINYPYYVGVECSTESDRSVTVPAAVKWIKTQWEKA